MKVTIGKINPINARLARLCHGLFWLALLFSFSDFYVYSQPTLTNKSREKDFGKSLKKYDPKSDTADDKAKKTDPPDDTIRVDTNLVVSDVLVVNQKGNVLLGLKKEDFIVTEDNIPQDVGMFSFGGNIDVPRSIVLIIDYSGSLRHYISESVNAAKILVDKMRPNDRMAIVTDDVKLLADFTGDKTLLKSKLDWIRKEVQYGHSGRSNQYQALLATLNELFSVEDVRPMIIFQTDGDEFLFFKPIDPKWRKFYPAGIRGNEERNFGFDDVLKVVERSRATIYSVVPGIRFVGVPQEQLLARGKQSIADFFSTFPQSSDLGTVEKARVERLQKEFGAIQAEQWSTAQNYLVEISKLSGGYTEFLERPQDAEDIYSSILKVVENRYIIGYYAKNETHDGKRRNVKIEVKGHPEYIVMGRKTYFAPGQ